MSGTWIKFEDKRLDWPVVCFTLPAWEAMSLRQERKALFDFEDPVGLERDVCGLLERTFPEYVGAILMMYGTDSPCFSMYFTFAHRDFPRVEPGVQPPHWSLLYRCACCRGPLREDLPWGGPSTLYYRQAQKQEGGGVRERLHAFCVPCQNAGFAEQSIRQLERGEDPSQVIVPAKDVPASGKVVFEFHSIEPRPIIVMKSSRSGG